MFAGVFGALIAVNWIWPLMIFIDDQSDGVNLDEGFFVALVLLMPATSTVLVFALVSIVAQAIKRRPLVKSIFNVGQVVTAVGAGALVFELLGGPGTAISSAKIGAAFAGAAPYFVVNTNAVAMIMKTFGTPWRKSVFGGFEAKVLIVLCSVSLAVPIAVFAYRDTWFLPIAVLPSS